MNMLNADAHTPTGRNARLGQGAHGVVMLGDFYPTDGREPVKVAVKQVRLNFGLDD